MPFTLQFPLEEMQQWADRYPGDDEGVYGAGRRIRDGNYTRANLEGIVRWKSLRRAGLIA
jgi:hypothetical protein